MSSAEDHNALRGFDSYEFRLGDELRGERATLGRSLLDVQRHLRIKAAYIAAIEDCDPEVFPNKGFIAGYVRSYARYLDLDADEVFARFCNESGFHGVNAGLSPRRDGADSGGGAGLSNSSAPDISFAPLMTNAASMQGRFSDISVSSLGSFVVLLMLIAGLGYGGFQVVGRLQQVEIAPLDQRPGALSEMAEIAAPGLGTEQVLPEVRTAAAQRSGGGDLTRLYQPRELEVPLLESRDGPIVEIDPQHSGMLRLAGDGDAAALDAVDAGLRAALNDQDPVVREEPVTPSVRIAAMRPAWVRISAADGTIVFEKILDAGEAYEVPADVAAPLLRSGNSGSVFVIVEDKLFGPVGKGTGVAKNVSLVVEDVRDKLAAVSEIPDTLQANVSALNAELE